MILTYCNTNHNHSVGKEVKIRSSPPQNLWNSLDTTENLRDADDDIKQNWYEFRETVWNVRYLISATYQKVKVLTCRQATDKDMSS